MKPTQIPRPTPGVYEEFSDQATAVAVAVHWGCLAELLNLCRPPGHKGGWSKTVVITQHPTHWILIVNLVDQPNDDNGMAACYAPKENVSYDELIASLRSEHADPPSVAIWQVAADWKGN